VSIWRSMARCWSGERFICDAPLGTGVAMVRESSRVGNNDHLPRRPESPSGWGMRQGGTGKALGNETGLRAKGLVAFVHRPGKAICPPLVWLARRAPWAPALRATARVPSTIAGVERA